MIIGPLVFLNVHFCVFSSSTGFSLQKYPQGFLFTLHLSDASHSGNSVGCNDMF